MNSVVAFYGMVRSTLNHAFSFISFPIYSLSSHSFPTDVDECHAFNPCYNNAACLNNNGSYTCNCTEGWQNYLCDKGKIFLQLIISMRVV